MWAAPWSTPSHSLISVTCMSCTPLHPRLQPPPSSQVRCCWHAAQTPSSWWTLVWLQQQHCRAAQHPAASSSCLPAWTALAGESSQHVSLVLAVACALISTASGCLSPLGSVRISLICSPPCLSCCATARCPTCCSINKLVCVCAQVHVGRLLLHSVSTRPGGGPQQPACRRHRATPAHH